MANETMYGGSEDVAGSGPTYSDTERAMVEYALRWVNHGGGRDTEIVEQFEVPSRDFFRRLIEVLDRDPGRVYRESGLSPVMVARMHAVARRRIWVAN